MSSQLFIEDKIMKILLVKLAVPIQEIYHLLQFQLYKNILLKPFFSKIFFLSPLTVNTFLILIGFPFQLFL